MKKSLDGQLNSFSTIGNFKIYIGINKMKKTILALTLLALSSNLAYSEEVDSELMAASQEYVINLLNMCKGYAQEDEIPNVEMEKYLITCINDELAESYYKPITVLPKND